MDRLTSIIIPTHKNLIEIKECAKSIYQHTENFEIIFVTDADNKYIKEISEFGRVITTPLPFNFSHRINMGIEEATGDYICLLNIDTVVEENWLKFAIKDDIMMGPGLVGLRCQTGGGSNIDAHGEGEAKYTNFTINMYGLLMSRRTYQIIGKLDQRFKYYGGEDDDYSLRALRNKLSLIVSRGKLFHSVGCGFDPVMVQQLLPKTRKLFIEKWGVDMPIPPAGSWVDETRKHLLEPLVSIIIPTRNHGDYILDCINSILEQSYKNFQIIVGVDGKDQKDTLKKMTEVSSIMKLDPKNYYVFPDVSRMLILQTNDQVGSCDMRNRCIEHAVGEFIALQDSDDIMLPERIKDTLKHFEDRELDIVFSDYILYDGATTKPHSLPAFNLENVLSLKCCVPGGTFMMRKGVARAEPFDPRYERAFDFEYVLRTIDRFKYKHHREPTIIYHRHGGEHLSGNALSANIHKELIRGYREKEAKKGHSQRT